MKLDGQIINIKLQIPYSRYISRVYIFAVSLINIACMHAAKRLLFRENLSNDVSAKVFTLEIYPLNEIRPI